MRNTMLFYTNLIKLLELSTTMSVIGPSGSTKSTAQTMFLSPNSNRILSGNIGDAAQTSLVDTIIGLTSELEIDEVCIKCSEKKYGTDFQDSVLETIWTKMYEKRDELEEFEVTDDMIKSILNPANKSYHAYEFILENNMDVEELKIAVRNLVDHIANNPDDLEDAVNLEFKKRKKIDKKPVKKQVFQKIVMERFFEDPEDLEKLEAWYNGLIDFIKEYFGKYWAFQDEFIIVGNIQENTEIEEFLKAVYDKNSAFSLAFSSLRYVVRPNDEFMKAYKKKYKVSENDRLKMSLNVLDTVGLTQTGDDKETIENAIEENLGKKVDAVLFLCAADSKPTVYQYCMEALETYAKKIENIPFTLCLTKADILLRNKMMNLCRQKTGKNVLDKEDYGEYLSEALDNFKNDYLEKCEFGEDSLGNNTENDNAVIEYVSMAPDLYEAMLSANSSLNDLNHIIEVMLNLFYAADKKYVENGIMRIQSAVPGERPIQIEMNEAYFNELAANLVEENDKNKNQYMKYVKGIYHGYSITCFFKKHSRGVGHDTHCMVYDDFKLHIKNMIRGWLTRNMIEEGEKAFHFDYSNVLFVNDTYKISFINKLEDEFREILHKEFANICDRVAKKLSYDCMEERFWECYNWKSRQEGFRENLKLFELLFSDADYWNHNLKNAFYDEYIHILTRMCEFIVEEV